MEQWKQDNRRDVVMVDIDQLVPKVLSRIMRKIVCRLRQNEVIRQ